MNALFRTSASILAGTFLSLPLIAQQRIETLFQSDNGGVVGGSVYFDLTVTNPGGIVVTGIDVNTSAPAGSSGTLEVYRTSGSHIGQEQNPGNWALTTHSNLGSSGQDGISVCALESSFSLPAGTTGIALCAPDFAHRYTNGNGANQSYSDANVTIDLGRAQNACLSGPVFIDRVANIAIEYYVPRQVSLVGAVAAQPAGAANATGVDYDTILDMLWTVDSTNQTVRSYTRAGLPVANLPAPQPPGSTTAPDPQRCAFDPGRGELWIYDGTARTVFTIGPNGLPTGSAFAISPALSVLDLTWADDTATLMVLATVGGSTSMPQPRIFEFDRSGVQIDQYFFPQIDADGVAYEHVSESFFVSSSSAGQVLEFRRDLATSVVHSLDPTLIGVQSYGLALDGKRGNLFFALGADIGTGGPDIPNQWDPASIMLTGSGCLNSKGWPPAQTANGCAKVGRSFRLITHTCAASSLYILGFAPLNPALDLAPIGASGCRLYQPTDFVSPMRPNTGSRTNFELAVPNNPLLIGLRIYNQALNLPDPGANPLGITLSNGCVIEIQR